MHPEKLTVNDVTYEQVAGTIDHSLLKPEMTIEEVLAGCELADRYQVVSVCVKPADVSMSAKRLANSTVAVGTVVGFPHGSSTSPVKVLEAEKALADGAVELDMVLNIGWLKSGEHERVEADIKEVVNVAGDDAIVKVILENAYLSDEEKVTGCQIVESAGGHFVKTSTGYAESGATIADLKLMRATVSEAVQVKAAAGVRTLDALLAVMEAGATRCGATRTAEMLDDYRERTSS